MDIARDKDHWTKGDTHDPSAGDLGSLRVILLSQKAGARVFALRSPRESRRKRPIGTTRDCLSRIERPGREGGAEGREITCGTFKLGRELLEERAGGSAKSGRHRITGTFEKVAFPI